MIQAVGKTADLPIIVKETDRRADTLRFVRAFMSERLAFGGFLFLVLVVVAALGADVLVNMGLLRDPGSQNLLLRNRPPGFAPNGTFALLGTDQLGRDEFSRIIFGARVSLSVGLATVLVAGVVGVILGLLAGFYRGWIDDVLMRLVDIQMGFPSLLLAMAVLYAAGSGIVNLILVLALTRWTITTRVIRGLTMSLRECAFVEAARSLGATDRRIMTRHLLPNVTSMIMVLGTLEFARAMLSEAALSFLGVGIQPPEFSWGMMLSQGRDYITSAWWLVAFPGIAIFLTTLSINLVATWLRSVSDPVQRWRWLQKGKPCESNKNQYAIGGGSA